MGFGILFSFTLAMAQVIIYAFLFKPPFIFPWSLYLLVSIQLERGNSLKFTLYCKFSWRKRMGMDGICI